jgi:hypothetical protein
MKRVFEVGDIFTVPVDPTRVGYGQIVHAWGRSSGHFYFALFDAVFARADTVNLDDALKNPLALLALSMDALLWHGIWQVVGKRDVNLHRLPFPAYKEGRYPPGTYVVVDHTGHRSRPATAEEVERLPFRQAVAPIRLQHAFQALHHIGDWRDDYDRLRPCVVDELTTAAVFGG